MEEGVGVRWHLQLMGWFRFWMVQTVAKEGFSAVTVNNKTAACRATAAKEEDTTSKVGGDPFRYAADNVHDDMLYGAA